MPGLSRKTEPWMVNLCPSLLSPMAATRLFLLAVSRELVRELRLRAEIGRFQCFARACTSTERGDDRYIPHVTQQQQKTKTFEFMACHVGRSTLFVFGVTLLWQHVAGFLPPPWSVRSFASRSSPSCPVRYDGIRNLRFGPGQMHQTKMTESAGAGTSKAYDGTTRQKQVREALSRVAHRAAQRSWGVAIPSSP